MEDPSASASMKSVEQNDIGNGNIQRHANRRYSNSYGRKPAQRAEQALSGSAACKAISKTKCCLRVARLPVELKHINKRRRRNQNEIGLVVANEDPEAEPESERSCGRTL